MPEDSQKIVDRIRDRLPSNKLNNQKVDVEQLHNRFRQCVHYAVSEAFKHADRGEKDPAVITKQLIENDFTQQAFYREYREGLGKLVKREIAQTDELNQLRTVENAQGRRNTLWRFVSTLAVGCAILLIYAAGEFFGIALPLSGIR